ncbi:MAG: ABC transporter permease, partial [Thermoleophilia bacterium]
MADTAQVQAPQAEPDDDDLTDGHEVSRWRRIAFGSTTSILLILIALIVVFSVLQFNEFATVSNLRNVATDAAVLLVLAVGMTYVIITAGIDLSVGAVLVFAGVISAKVMSEVGGNGWGVIILGVVAGVIAGLAWGVVNGVLVTKAKVPPLIVTLGTLGMAQGAALLITHGVDERDVPTKLVDTIGTGELFGQIPWLVVIAVVVAVVAGVWLRRTRFGGYTYAVGSNIDAPLRAGIAVDRHLIKVYALAGFLSGLAGFMNLARFGTTTVSGHATDNLNAIAAVVIGGTLLTGGRGTLIGSILGVLVFTTITNLFILNNLATEVQNIAKGLI